MYKKYWLIFFSCLVFTLPNNILANNTTLNFQDIFYESEELLDGLYSVSVNIVSEAERIWTQSIEDVEFINGLFSISIGSESLDPKIFSLPDIFLELQVNVNGIERISTYNFTFIPYCISAKLVEEVESVQAERIYGEFTNTFNIGIPKKTPQDILLVGKKNTKNEYTFYGGHYNQEKKAFYVGIRESDPQYMLDVAGIINVDIDANKGALLIGEESLIDIFSWEKSATNTLNIVITNNISVGIGISDTKGYAMNVVGTVNAQGYKIAGVDLPDYFNWATSNISSKDIYYDQGRIGIGRVVAQNRTDVNGALTFKESKVPTKAGMLRWTTEEGYQGFKNDEWADMISVEGDGVANKIAHWLSSGYLKSSYPITLLDHNIGIGSPAPEAKLSIQGSSLDEDLLKITSGNISKFYVSSSKNICIGNDNPQHNLRVVGTIDAKSLRLHGVNLTKMILTGTYWLLNPEDESIYYIAPPQYPATLVGIGRPDPSSNLEIAARNKNPEEPTNDPAITFTRQDVSYTMGIDADTSGIFRVESGKKLGQANPLFVAYQGRFGVGLAKPEANLHVSGDIGLIMTGQFEATSSVTVEGPGVRLIWLPHYSALRLGYLDVSSPLQGHDWDAQNIGKYTIAMGKNVNARGVYSNVLGGENNGVVGAYSTILGGQDNSILGDFSFSGGRNVKSDFHGTYIWGANQMALLDTNHENQFLISAEGGAAIGTSNTSFGYNKTVALTLQNSQAITYNIELLDEEGIPYQAVASAIGTKPTGNVLYAYGNPDDNQGMAVISVEGALGVGTSDPGSAKLAVFGRTGIGVTRPTADLHIEDDHEFLLIAVGDQGITSPSIVVNASKNVGIGMYPEMELESGGTLPLSGYIQAASGNILATEFVFPDGQKIATGEGMIVWNWEDTTPNINFISGNVGIGTTSPNSLLELSNQNIAKDDPIITWDLDGQDIISMGVSQLHPLQFRISPSSSAVLKTHIPPFTIKNNFVGIGETEPVAPLHVQDVALFEKYSPGVSSNILQINHGDDKGLYAFHEIITGEETVVDMAVPSVNAVDLYIDGEEASAGGVKWFQQEPPEGEYKIWRWVIVNAAKGLYKYIGIGTEYPEVELHIAGTLKIQPSSPEEEISLFVNEEIQVRATFNTEGLYFRDENGDVPFMYVENGHLLLRGMFGTTALSDVFSRGNSDGGYLAMCVPPPPTANNEFIPRIAYTQMYWDDVDSILTLTGNVSYVDEVSETDIYQTLCNVELGPENLNSLLVSTQLKRNINDLYSAHNHQAKKINVILPNIQLESRYIHGLEIYAKTQPREEEAYIGNDCEFGAVRINVGDVIQIQDTGSETNTSFGYKFSGIFLTGTSQNVGIGKEPTTELDVSGVVSANTFIISQQLSVGTLNVRESMWALEYNRIGIGTSKPSVELEIVEDTEVEDVSANTVLAKNLNIHDGSFLATESKIGMQIKDADIWLEGERNTGQWEIYKEFNINPSTDYKVEKIYAQVASDNNFTLAKNMLGLDIQIRTSQNNFFGNSTTSQIAKGIDINFDNIETGYQIDLGQKNIITGLHVIVTDNPQVLPTACAAIFMGGNVGIGQTQPENLLEVNGTIHAADVLNINLQGQQHAASINHLIATTLNVYQTLSAQNIIVNRIKIPKEKLKLFDDTISAYGLFVQELYSTSASMNIITANTIASDSGDISANIVRFEALGIGTDTPLQGMNVDGRVSANQLIVSSNYYRSQGLFAEERTSVDVNNILKVSEQKFVGIGYFEPETILHVLSQPKRASVYELQKFLAEDNSTWYAVNISNAARTKNYAVGIIFAPDESSYYDVGSGILGIRSTDELISGSSLAFVTDPILTEPQERMRITSSGNIGIGTAYPSADLHVLGTAYIEELQPTKNLAINLIKSNDGIDAITINIQSTTDVSSILSKSKLMLHRLDPPEALIGYEGLYTNIGDNALYYLSKVNDVEIRNLITSNITVTSTSLPYYSDLYQLNDSEDLIWDEVNSTLRFQRNPTKPFGNGNKLIYLNNTIISENYDAHFKAQMVKVALADRTTPAHTAFIGFGIDIEHDVNTALIGLERLWGLKVNMEDNLLRNTTLSNGEKIAGKKYAAIFLNSEEDEHNLRKSKAIVGINGLSQSSLFHPSANLHIQSCTDNYAFRIDSSDTLEHTLVISKESQLGLGLTEPSAILEIKTSNQISPTNSFEISNSQETIMFVGNNLIGIKTQNPSADIDINGTVSSNILTAESVISDLMVVNKQGPGLIVDDKGYVGIGLTVPEAQLDIQVDLTSPNNQTNYIAQAAKLEVDKDNLKNNLTGLDISIQSNSTYDLFKGNANQVEQEVYALKIITNELVAATNNIVIGLNVKVPTGNLPALFLGGNVGVGISEPENILEISQGLRGINLDSHFVDLKDVNHATFNNIIVTQNIEANKMYLVNKTDEPNMEVISTCTITEDVETKISPQGSNKLFTIERNLYVDEIQFDTLAITTHDRQTINEFLGSFTARVSSNVLATNNLIITNNNLLELDRIYSAQGIFIDKNLDVQNTTTVNLYIKAEYFALKQLSSPPVLSSYQTLYTEGESLKYNHNSLGDNLLGTATNIPYYNENGDISSSGGLTWTLKTDDTQRFGNNGLIAVSINARINQEVYLDNIISAEKINLSFDRRINADTNKFYGAYVVLDSNTDHQPFGNNEKGAGLYVNTDKFINRYYSEQYASQIKIGAKAAAVFLGSNTDIQGTYTTCNVGISTTTSLTAEFLPQATLHVSADQSDRKGLLIETKEGDPIFVVNNEAKVGINKDSLNAKLNIKGIDVINNISIQNEEDEDIFVLQKGGKVAIGVDELQASLEVRNTNLEIPPLKAAAQETIAYLQEEKIRENLLTLDPYGRFSIGQTDDTTFANMLVIKDYFNYKADALMAIDDIPFEGDLLNVRVWTQEGWVIWDLQWSGPGSNKYQTVGGQSVYYKLCKYSETEDSPYHVFTTINTSPLDISPPITYNINVDPFLAKTNLNEIALFVASSNRSPTRNRVGIKKEPAVLNGLQTLGKTMVGSSEIELPDFLLADTTYGFYAQTDDNLAFLGTRSIIYPQLDNQATMFFEHNQTESSINILVLGNTTKEYLRLSGTGQVSIGTTQPSGNLHIKTNSNDSILWLENPMQNALLVIDKDGKIGIGTSLPVADLYVSATTNVLLGVKNQTPNGTVGHIYTDVNLLDSEAVLRTDFAQITGLNKEISEALWHQFIVEDFLTDKGFLTEKGRETFNPLSSMQEKIDDSTIISDTLKNIIGPSGSDLAIWTDIRTAIDATRARPTCNTIIFSRVGDADEHHQAVYVSMNIVENIKKQDVGGLSIILAGELSSPFNRNIIGVSVDVTSVCTNDVSAIGHPYDQPEQGEKYAAVFMGGTVGIGVGQTTSSTTQNTTLIHYDYNTNGDQQILKTVTPNAWLEVLPMTAMGLPQENNAGPVARFTCVEKGGNFLFYSSGLSDHSEGIPTLAFTVKPGVTYKESKLIRDELIKSEHGEILKLTNSPLGGQWYALNNEPTYDEGDYNKDENWSWWSIFAANPDPKSDMILNSITKEEVKRIIALYSNPTVSNFYIYSSYLGQDESIMYLASGTKGYLEQGLSAGRLGIYTDKPLAALHLGKTQDGHKADMRLGMQYNSNTISEMDSDGKKLWLSGGPAYSISDGEDPLRGSENKDLIYMCRKNYQNSNNPVYSVSELRWNVGEMGQKPSALFTIGYSFGQSKERKFGEDYNIYGDGYWAADILVVKCGEYRTEESLEARGFVGICTRNALAALHVCSTRNPVTASNPQEVTGHVVIVENDATNARQTHSLAIKTNMLVGRNANFITFLVRDIISKTTATIGSIEGYSDSAEGVRFSSPDADYAEYLLKNNPQEILNKGDIIGVYQGKISKNTSHAEQIMVMSSAPVIAGNWPKKDAYQYGLVAFMGQVPIKVKGSIQPGDYIIPSGLNDGIGQAIKAQDIDYTMIDKIVGKALEANDNEDTKLVKTLIGFPFNMQRITQDFASLDSLQNQVQELHKENQQLANTYLKKLDQRQKIIEELKKKIN
jgi:hypothetical protein